MKACMPFCTHLECGLLCIYLRKQFFRKKKKPLDKKRNIYYDEFLYLCRTAVGIKKENGNKIVKICYAVRTFRIVHEF
jgi:hypothetical protein